MGAVLLQGGAARFVLISSDKAVNPANPSAGSGQA
jgi:FlaA1/EpsC-like NDP-sugar epimerase